MAIQMRRGNAANYDETKMLPGEFAVATDEEELYIAFATGNSKKVLTEDDYTPDVVQKVWTGTCSTAKTTAVKVVTLDNPDGFSLVDGVTICVYFANGSSANSPALNVNDTGNKSVYYMTSSVTGSMIGSKVPHKYFGVGYHIFTYNSNRWYRDFGDMANIDYLNTQLGAMSLTATDQGDGVVALSIT